MQQLKTQNRKKFANNIDKVKAILGVFRKREKLTGDEIAERLEDRGYRVKSGHLKMFIRYRMLYKHLKKEVIGRKIYYSLL